MAFTLIQYLHLTFESVSAEFGPVWVKLAVLRTKMRKRSILTFDLTLTWHVTFSEFFKSALEPSRRDLSNAASPVSLRSLVWELAWGGGVIRPPPGQWHSAETPVKRGLVTVTRRSFALANSLYDSRLSSNFSWRTSNGVMDLIRHEPHAGLVPPPGLRSGGAQQPVSWDGGPIEALV